MTRLRWSLLVLAAATPAPAMAQSCADLWYQRNAIYKDSGYCFRTPRAIQAFGNAGCQFDDMGSVPLSPRQRAIVADIVRRERYMGCGP